MTVIRVLPDDLYNLVMDESKEVAKGAVFEEIVRRFGDPDRYEKAQMGDMKMNCLLYTSPSPRDRG